MPVPSEDLAVTARHDVYPGIDLKPHYDAQTFKGKVVLVTGASRGLGEEMALSYALAGASVVIVSRRQAVLDAVKSRINSESPEAAVLSVVADVVETKQVQAAVQAAVAKFGKLDIVIANAGMSDPWDKPLTKHDPDRWWKTVEVNLRGVFNVAHFALPHLDQTKGYFVIISSVAAQYRFPLASSYSVSKHAVGRFNEFIAIEHPDVKTFAVHPGAIKTEGAMENHSAMEAMMVDSRRLPAAVAIRLTSGRDNYLSGKFISATWDLDEVEKKYKARIVEDGALVSRLAVPQ